MIANDNEYLTKYLNLKTTEVYKSFYHQKEGNVDRLLVVLVEETLAEVNKTMKELSQSFGTYVASNHDNISLYYLLEAASRKPNKYFL